MLFIFVQEMLPSCVSRFCAESKNYIFSRVRILYQKFNLEKIQSSFIKTSIQLTKWEHIYNIKITVFQAEIAFCLFRGLKLSTNLEYQIFVSQVSPSWEKTQILQKYCKNFCKILQDMFESSKILAKKHTICIQLYAVWPNLVHYFLLSH